MKTSTKGSLFSALVLYSTILGAVTASQECATDLDILIPRTNTIYHDNGDGSTSSVDITTTVELHQYLLRCADTVKSLKLRTASQGCSEHPDRYNLPLDLAGGERYPNLTSLRLDGYEFHQSEHLDSLPSRDEWWSFAAWIKWLHAPPSGFSRPKRPMNPWNWWSILRKTPMRQLNKTNLELFLEAMDWSALQRLELGINDVDDTFVDLVAPHLGGVKHLRLEGFGEKSQAAERRLIRSLPRKNQLESLEWLRGDLSMDHELQPVLEQQGGALKKLQIGNEHPWPGSGLPAPWIETIANEAPNVEDFTFTMDRNGTWPLETFQSLVKMRNLEHATIHMQLQSECGRLHDSQNYLMKPYDDDTRFEVCDLKDPYYMYQTPMPTLTNVWRAFISLQDFVRDADHEDAMAYSIINTEAEIAGQQEEERKGGKVTGGQGLKGPEPQRHRLKTVDFKSGDFGRGYDGPLAILSDWEGRRNHVRCVDALPPPPSGDDGSEGIMTEKKEEEEKNHQGQTTTTTKTTTTKKNDQGHTIKTTTTIVTTTTTTIIKKQPRQFGVTVGQPACFHIEGHLYPGHDAAEPDWLLDDERDDYPGNVLYAH